MQASGTNCIKIGLTGKLILSKRKGLREIVSENRFSGKTYFYTIASRRVSSFLGKPVAESNVAALAEFLSFDKMKANPAMNKQNFVDVSVANGPLST